MDNERIIEWLMDGDVAIQYQVSRDILHSTKTEISALRERIAKEGWGARFLAKQKKDGHWGITFYQPKWTSTHYTLLDLKTISLPNDNKQAKKSTSMVLDQPQGYDGGINLAGSLKYSDVCVNGMILNYSSYFLSEHPVLKNIVDYLLHVQMADGGWNCRYLNPDTSHSSLHSTLSVLEGLLEFRRTNIRYRAAEIKDAEKEAVEFLLKHNLYQSHRTGHTIDEKMLRLSFPCRWRYDILRCLDYLRDAEVSFDLRMQNALEIILNKRRKDGKWLLQQRHAGLVHFDMEKAGTISRWNTLRALRVLSYFNNI
ncbi:MAG: hypothetical protein C0490_15420 [Marivirga sp.]|nr:hypothetical protein [Marivirga sp.]